MRSSVHWHHPSFHARHSECLSTDVLHLHSTAADLVTVAMSAGSPILEPPEKRKKRGIMASTASEFVAPSGTPDKTFLFTSESVNEGHPGALRRREDRENRLLPLSGHGNIHGKGLIGHGVCGLGRHMTDKLADRVSDAVLDACLEQDPNAKVACGACEKADGVERGRMNPGFSRRSWAACGRKSHEDSIYYR